jgi:hypothetical protein
MSKKLQKILEAYPDEQFTVADGFDEAVVGIDTENGRLVYSVPTCVDILMNKHGMDYEEAIEFFHYNVADAFVGYQTPIWINDKF